MATTQTKVTLRLGREILDAARTLAGRRGITVTEVFRRAISTEKYLDDATARGEKVLLTDGETTREVVFR